MQFESVDFNNSKSLGIQVTEIIEQKIRNREITVGEKLPTQNELCRVFDVSIDTVLEALSNLVREGYICRRRKLGTFVINSNPGINILERKNGICLVVCPFKKDNLGIKKTNPRMYMEEIIRGVEERVSEKGAFLVYTTLKEGKLSLAGEEKDIAGLIVAGVVTPGLLKIIKKSQIPFVLIGDIIQSAKTDENVGVICSDDFKSTYVATKHLLDLGHKRILYIAPSLGKYPWEREELRGYQEAHREAGVTCDKNLQIGAETRGLNDGGYKVMKEFLDKSIHAEPIPFTAMVYLHDYLGIGIMQAIEERGLRIPEDISVVAVDAESPKLTTVVNDYEKTGEAAAEVLLEKITNPDSKPKRVVVPGRLITRNSTRQI
jgi:DNA-binding LacI/PurR family transcriptional regulator